MQTKVLYNKRILPDYYKLGISYKPMPAIQSGQFVMLRINERIDPLLRRPFGIYKILGTKGKGQGIEIIYKVVGKGTKLMTGLKLGDAVDVLGPLGNGFSAPDEGHQIIMVAGGIGIVPFYMIGSRVKAGAHQRWARARIKLLFGGRSKDDLPGLDDFKKLKIDIKISTQDGSIGKKGLVTDLLKSEIGNQKSKIIYACGPKAMLKTVAKIAEDAGIPCYVSLDNAMACGMGACLGCAVKVKSKKEDEKMRSLEDEKKILTSPPLNLSTSIIYKMVCKDGPVFDAREIAWEEL